MRFGRAPIGAGRFHHNVSKFLPSSREWLAKLGVLPALIWDQGKTLKDVLAANLTAPYDKTTLGDTQQSKDRFITEVYDEVKDFPAVVDGKRTMPVHQ